QPRPLADAYLSRTPWRLRRDPETGTVRLLNPENKTRIAADGVWISDQRDFTAEEVRRGVVLELAERVVLLLHEAPEIPGHAPGYAELIGENEKILRLRNEIRHVADLDVPVLIRGETGTGKELVARAIHAASRRHGPPCLCVNMGAIPPSLAPSALFGAVRGAFTGAVNDQPGYFQRADGGTLFLDEIGEAPAEVQVMLLRVLETGEVQRVGSPAPQKVDVRLLAATDVDLERAIEDGRFRAPLLHRLAGYQIVIPPLRERRDDFGRLLVHFLRQELGAIGEERRLLPAGPAAPWLPASIVARLARHPWPGNVRQLRNAVRQMVIDSRRSETVQIGPQIESLLREVDAQPEPTPEPSPAPPPTPARRRQPAKPYRVPSQVPVEEVLAALRGNAWEVKPTAAQLGISRPSLYVLIKKIPGLRKAADLSRAEILQEQEQCQGDLAAAALRLEVSHSGLLLRMKQLGLLIDQF
ncbi:MAG TPA: sigma 54-interacting transcriptional regulator, partial [Thermoanaerobaculia bacterium]|nr:sigma 54-interacting transcriptional regulator [Thermoanaerobaculia bacterium]